MPQALIIALKVLLILAIMLLMAYPLLPLPLKLRRFSTFYALKYKAPENKRNFPFVIFTLVEFIVLAVSFRLIDGLVDIIGSISLIEKIVDKSSAQMKFSVSVIIGAIIVNLVFIYLLTFGKGLLKKLILDPIFGFRQKKSETDVQTDAAEEAEAEDKPENAPDFVHSNEETQTDETKKESNSAFEAIKNAIYGLFFRGEDFRYAKRWVWRAEFILQIFVYSVEVIYLAFFAFLLAAVIFPMPEFIYTLLTPVITRIYLYPFISLVFLQEICNTLHAELETWEPVHEGSRFQKADKKREASIKKLHAKLIRNYGKAHNLKYFIARPNKKVPEYRSTNEEYRDAVSFIKNRMKLSTGTVVQSYMRGIDAAFGGHHVYFGESFYSEIGEYLSIYCYIRLLAGERIIFIVPSQAEVYSMKKYLERLNRLAGCGEDSSWRIRDASERLDQADVYIAVPEDFRSDNIVENNREFFADACNALVIDADKIVSLDAYLCTIISNRLRNASDNNIKFLFFTTHLYQGFVKSLRRFFKTDENIAECNSAEENRDVTYMLWNYESGNIYEKNGQKIENPDTIIAHEAYIEGIDGIKVFSTSPIDVEKMLSLKAHRIEVNENSKEQCDVSYLICVDDGFNLASAIYAYTRFRGKKASVVHLLNKPCLLREYFSSDAKSYVNRSSYLKPRIAECADDRKLILLDLFCNAAISENKGMRLDEFVKRIDRIMLENGALSFEDYEYIRCLSREAPSRPLKYSRFIERLLNELDKNKTVGISRAEYEEIQVECNHPDFSNTALAEFFVQIDRYFDQHDNLVVDEFERLRNIYANSDIWAERYVITNNNDDRVAYLLENLTGEKYEKTYADKGYANPKSYYRLTNSRTEKGYTLKETGYILFLFVERVFDKLLEINSRVELWLNGEMLGRLDTFPSRVYQQCIPGQSIVFNNCEYEIESISSDRRKVYLRQENVTYKNCLDTVYLRKFKLDNIRASQNFSGVFGHTRGVLEKVTVSMCNAKILGKTYGFYNLMTDSQTLDLWNGVVGNDCLENSIVEATKRDIEKGIVLSIELKSRRKCTDGMRLLLSAVFTEFLRTVFPKAYHCVAVCPVLKEPISESYIPGEYSSDSDGAEREKTERFNYDVRKLYPYLVDSEPADDNSIKLYVVNDCEDNVGVLDTLYDGAARVMEELLSNIHRYLVWLGKNPILSGEQNHFIYFGYNKLPEVYDLEGLAALLENCNREFVRTDMAKDNVEDEDVSDMTCSFCHSPLELGRYSKFSKNRYSCIDCEAEAVFDQAALDDVVSAVRKYVKDNYVKAKAVRSREADDNTRSIYLLDDVKVVIDSIYALNPDEVFSEFYYKVDIHTRTVYVERDNPYNSAFVSVLRGLIFFWQYDRGYWAEERYQIADALTAQLYYEELKYLRSHKAEKSADWIYENLDDLIKSILGEIDIFIGGEQELVLTSFDYIKKIAEEDMVSAGEEEDFDDSADVLYDPDEVPRFWKKYLYDDSSFDDRDDEEDYTDDGNASIEDEVSGEDDEKLFKEMGAVNGHDLNCPPNSDEDNMTDTEDQNEICMSEMSEDTFENRVEDSYDTSEDGQTMDEADEIPNDTPEDIVEAFDSGFDGDDVEDLPEENSNEESFEEPDDHADQEADDRNRQRRERRGVGGWFKRRRKPQEEDLSDDTDEGSDSDQNDKKRKKLSLSGIKSGMDIVPYEEAEETNPKIKLYNEIARAMFDYRTDPIDVPSGLTLKMVKSIFYMVLYDYPEIFWICNNQFSYEHIGDRITSLHLIYRYLKPDNTVDIKRINKCRKEIRSNIKPYIKGIDKKTSPYEAVLTIYRRVIAAMSYDGASLEAGRGIADMTKDDELRSLYSAFTKRKVVCQGYAVAMQYLLQSVGICCGQMVSETHSWNVVKIGKSSYYLDATWGDMSNTKNADGSFDDVILYNYCCVNERENNLGGQDRIPDREIFVGLKEYKATKYEYFRYHRAFLTRYDEDKLAEIFATGLLKKQKAVGFRASSPIVYKKILSSLGNGGLPNVLEKAKRILLNNKKKSLIKRLNGRISSMNYEKENICYYVFMDK